MEAGSAEDQKILLLRHAVENVGSPSQRNEILSRFHAATAKFPNAACGLLMRSIEKLLKQKIKPVAEINALFTFVMSSNDNFSLLDILSMDLPQRYSKLEYFLRIYTLRTLMTDKSISVSRHILHRIAGNRDIGRISVIDFILTRQSSDPDLVQLMELLVSELENKRALQDDAKRYNAVAQLKKKFAHSRKELDFKSIISHTRILAEWDKLVKCEPSEIREWLAYLQAELQSQRLSDSKLRALSSCLINLGSAFRHDPVVVDMWNLAIDSEFGLPTPSPQIQQKVWRLCLALRLHPAASHGGIIRGLSLSFMALGIPKSAETLDNNQLKSFSSISGALAQLPNWSNLSNAVVSNNEYCVLIRWFLMIVASSTKMEMAKNIADRLMTVDQTYLLQTRLEMEQAYCSLYGKCFDETSLQAIANASSARERNITLCLLAKSRSTQGHTMEAWNLCRQLTDSQLPLVQRVLDELGFVDIAKKLGLNVLPDTNIPLHELNARIKVSKQSGEKSSLIYLFLTAWLALVNGGCYQDSSRYLSAALLTARQVLGSHSVRYMAISRLQDQFYRTLSLSNDHVADSAPSESKLTGLEHVVSENVSVWLSCRLDYSLSFTQKCERLSSQLNKDPVLSAFAVSATACPPLVKSDMPCAYPEISALFQKTFNFATDSRSPAWIDRMQIARHRLWLHLLGCNLNLLTEPQNLLSNSQSVPRIQGEPIQASREFHSGKNGYTQSGAQLPPDTICLCLSFDDDDVLSITRLEKDFEPIALRLPAERWSDLRLNDHEDDSCSVCLKHSDAVKRIEVLIEESTQISVTDARKFWELQTSLDSQLQRLIEELQKTWIGGFTGIISTPVGGFQYDEGLTTVLESTLIRNFGYQRSANHKIAWSLSPIVVPLLCSALERGQSDEIEDLVTSMLDSLRFQGLPVAHDEISIWDLISDIKAVLRSSSGCGSMRDPSERRRVLLVCDRKAAQIPWELFPVLKECSSVTRALSLQQAEEWAKLPPSIPKEVSYLINPDQDLPPTHRIFIQNFKQRGWSGLAGIKPKEEEIAAQIRKSPGFIYLGHGSGKNYIRGSSLRKLYATASSVFLLGCNSVRVKHPMLDDDALTEYAVMGSQIIMGTLWAVKDKDFNRFSHEFLSRVFDEKEPVGEALREARNACVLRYLTGGAAVVYGLP